MYDLITRFPRFMDVTKIFLIANIEVPPLIFTTGSEVRSGNENKQFNKLFLNKKKSEVLFLKYKTHIRVDRTIMLT